MTDIIHVSHLRKEFRRPRRGRGLLGHLRTLATRTYDVTTAVNDVSFDVAEGEVVGYIGRNGAGKSTTIKLMTGILVPTSGEVTVHGLVPWRERVRNALNIGVVFGQRTQLWWDLPLIDSLDTIGKLYRLDPQRYRRNLERLTELLEMRAFLETPVRQLSLGQRMRGDLAAAMIYEPPLLFLDEPTVGLDVLARERVRAFIQDVNRTNRTTVILTTHDLRDVERLCNRIIVIERGALLFDDSVQHLKSRYAPDRVLVLQFEKPVGRFDLPGARWVRSEGTRTWLSFDASSSSVPYLIGLAASRQPVVDVAIEEPSLEDVVHRLFAGGEIG